MEISYDQEFLEMILSPPDQVAQYLISIIENKQSSPYKIQKNYLKCLLHLDENFNKTNLTAHILIALHKLRASSLISKNLIKAH